MDSQPTSDAYTQSDTGKSGQQVGLERQGVVSEKMEDGANSLHEINVGASGNASKKTGSIKIKTSKELGSSVNHSTDPVPARTESPHKRESEMAGQDSRYNKQELGTLLIRLFNSCLFMFIHQWILEQYAVILNRVASIIIPRMFSEMWRNNCYNSKGDYSLDLMRRVKKNFTKYWTAAGLCNGQPRGTNEKLFLCFEISSVFRRHHKADCLCAICVLKSHRREREENDRIAKSHGASDNSLAQELKQEESSLAESPGGNSSSDMDGSLEPNIDAEVEEKGEDTKMVVSKQQYGPSGDKQEDDEGNEEEDSDTEMKDEDDGEALEQFEKAREEPNKQLLPITADASAGESQERQKKVKAYESLQFENPKLLDLCGTLFPNNSKSICHSIVRFGGIPLHAAINMLMK
ncbi:hypothetical protein EV1_044254 [Malus domestica]